MLSCIDLRKEELTTAASLLFHQYYFHSSSVLRDRFNVVEGTCVLCRSALRIVVVDEGVRLLDATCSLQTA